MLARPKDIGGILENLRVAIVEDCFYKDYFLSDISLLNLSGGERIDWLLSSTTRGVVELSGFDAVVPRYHVGELSLPGISYILSRTVRDGEAVRVSARLQLTGHNPSASFECVEKIFGSGWADYRESLPPHGRVFLPSTDVHGNQRIRYVFDTLRASGSLILEFQADGTLYTVDFESAVRP